MWNDYRINIVDTPATPTSRRSRARAVVVDSVLLLVDAVDGPMPQTASSPEGIRHGFSHRRHHKIDRPGARAHWVLDQTFELFDRLGGTDEQLDFPVVYASALNGYAGLMRLFAKAT